MTLQDELKTEPTEADEAAFFAGVEKVVAEIRESAEKHGVKTAKYRKKPVIIEAYQTNIEMDIETLEGTMHASVGDYIITGVDGEQYPCKPDIFEKTYDPV